jgi:L-Ala-D/L-Glu epimerase
MRITVVRVDTLRIPFREPITAGRQRFEHRRAGILTLATDDGQAGHGEFTAPEPADLGEDVSPRLVQVLKGIHLADPVAVEGALRDIDTWPFVGRAARAATESALVELLARASGRSVAAFLGPAPAAEVAVNALLGVGSPGETAARAADLVAAGFRCLKLKAGDEPVSELVSRVGAVREAVGATVALRVDFNGTLAVKAAEDALQRLASFELEYVEQPIAVSAGWEALAHLRWTGAVPIAADESVRDVGAARALLDAAAVDALVVKPARVGGLRQASAIIDLATAAAVPVTVSTLFETGVGLAGALHLAAIAPGPQAHGLATAELLESDLLAQPLALAGGRMRLPDGPGLGIVLDAGAIERYRAA